ncbi:uncharacterized protein TrAFT101_011170 [Trichoderma asperellum]|uniref:Uncharacterized protein n=1 Tax=Trichoderma asperellum (strain ATCC 204424 / CBS 433.97 / NBRC 101777) TaxID=1042311 RepID=A0A2T3YY04_TRIA4|nr:hypothetical protein M441DRAFT_148835 [Trichoderma asperellum CBS 433.97]PTB37453.1 hypothetical protein M441DRAFT_148835 [Trichoderma asperellum CBS 433.97]UKZ96379.1 hypothetical protein TrAFT101_011170 [Trichoderma asperellum]
MATLANKKTDEFSFDIQLDTVTEDRGYHSRNTKNQVQRPDVVDDICQGLLVQARIDRIVHGTQTKGGKPATLVIFGFRFHGIGKKRRFREAAITILFQDEKKQEDADPVVAFLWPNGDFTLGEQTDVDTEEKAGGEIGVNAGLTYGGVDVKRTWEQRRSYRQTDRASLTGSIMLDTNVRDSGLPNAVLLNLSENETARSGLVTDFRAAVLLFRENNLDKFTAKISVDAKANFYYNLVKSIRDVTGHSPANDPILFQPGPENQYIRPVTLARYLEDKLAEEVDEQNLNSKRLNRLVGVLGATALATNMLD